MTDRLAVVFGGSGFLGRNVVRELARRGWRIRAAVRRPHHAQFLRPMGAVGQVQLFQANVRNRPSVERAVEGADAVINLVGILHQDGAQSFARVQAQGAVSIAVAAAKHGVTKLVHVSAIGADPESDSLYARTKGEAERAVRETVPSATILRPSVVFGPEDKFYNKFGALFAMSPAFIPLPLLFGGGGSKFQPVYVDDVADAVCAALDRPAAAGRTYELGGPRVYTFHDMLKFVEQETGRNRILLPVPFAVAPLIGLAGEALGALPFFAPPVTRDQITLMKRDNIVSDGAEGLAALGVTPKTVESIVPSYMVQYRRYGQFSERLAEEAR